MIRSLHHLIGPENEYIVNTSIIFSLFLSLQVEIANGYIMLRRKDC